MVLWLMLVEIGGIGSLVKSRELYDDVMVDAGVTGVLSSE